MRGIPPDLADEAGIYTEGNAMRIPHYDVEGDVWAVQRRPHHRREGVGKYLFDKGTQMGIYVPPSEREKLLALSIPIILTESALKALAIIADLRRHGLADRYAVISIPGVTTWQRDGTAIPDFEFFPSRHKEHGKIAYRRPLIIAFDSNAATNPDVISARWGLTSYARGRRKHDVQWIDVPEGPGETPKARERGIDDVLNEGIATMPEMLASTYPAPDIMPAIDLDTIDADDLSEVERLRMKCDTYEARALRAERYVSLLTELAISPHYTDNEKVLIIRAGACALAEGAHEPLEGDVVKLDAGKLSNDLRPTDKEHPDYEAYKRSPVNPIHQDARGHHFGGDHWYMRRSSVVPTIKSLERKLKDKAPIHAKPDYIREPGDPSPRRVSVITMTRPDNMIDFLQAVTSYRPDAAARPYTTQEPCPHCHEIHPRTRRTFCDGCGKETEKPQHLPVPVASNPDATDEQRAELDASTAAAPIIDMETGQAIDRATGEVLQHIGPTPVNRKNLFTDTNAPVNSPSSVLPPVTRCSENIYLPDEPGATCGAINCTAPVERDGMRCPEHTMHKPADRSFTLEVSA